MFRIISSSEDALREASFTEQFYKLLIMSKLTLIILLLATLLQIQAFKNVQYHTQNPYTVAIGSQLYTVSQNLTHIWIVSTDKNLAPCKIAVDSTKVSFFSRIKATTVSQKIIVWGERSQEKINNGATRRTNYVVLLLDPKQCTYKVLPDFVDEVPSSQVHIPAEIVTHQNSFDVFLPDQSKCSPCRYNTNGEKMAAIGQMKHTGSPKARFHVREIANTNTYYYIYNFDNGNAKVWKLDENYQDLESPTMFASTTINDFAVGYDGKNSYFGYSKIYPTKSSYLILLNDRLEFNQFIRLPRIANHVLYKTLTSFDSQGNWHVVLLFRSNLVNSTSVRLVRYTADGALINEHNFGTLDNNKNYDVQAVLVDDSKDCVVMHDLTGGVTEVKCVA